MEINWEKLKEYVPNYHAMSTTSKVMALVCVAMGGVAFGTGHWVMGTMWSILGLVGASVASSKSFTDKDMIQFLHDLQERSPKTYRALWELAMKG
mgnify:CR=1 FL=1